MADHLACSDSAVIVMRGENDEMIANEVEKRIRQYAFFTIYDDVEGAVRDGVVTLTGKATMSLDEDTRSRA